MLPKSNIEILTLLFQICNLMYYRYLGKMNNSYTGVINKNIYLYTFIVSIEFGFQFRYLVSYFKH